MASLYKNNGIWYISVTFNGSRKCKSLRTKDIKIAKQLKRNSESLIIAELNGLEHRNENLSFSELVERFLHTDHNWSDATSKLITYILKSHLNGKPLPVNPTSRAIHIRHINQCWNWGLNNNLIIKANKINGDTKGEARHRTYTSDELNLMFTSIKDDSFNSFVRFAYYTGARSGEIRSISRDNVLEGSLVVRGKTGRRYVKLNSQAIAILDRQESLWNYSRDFVSHKFKKEVRRLGIRNARFHDLRRTFGLNLIKQGMSIYKVSKLLGHKSVRTTEQHYAPLLTVDIEDFEL
jgi:integrase